jgi:hypothetical protein
LLIISTPGGRGSLFFNHAASVAGRKEDLERRYSASRASCRPFMALGRPTSENSNATVGVCCSNASPCLASGASSVGEFVYPLAERLANDAKPFVFLTGYNAADLPPHFRSIIRIAKPYDPEILMRQLRRLLSKA